MLTAQEARKIADEVLMGKELKKLEKKIQDAAEKGHTQIKTKGDKSKQFWSCVENLGFSVYHDKLPLKEHSHVAPHTITYVSWPFYSDDYDTDTFEKL